MRAVPLQACGWRSLAESITVHTRGSGEAKRCAPVTQAELWVALGCAVRSWGGLLGREGCVRRRWRRGEGGLSTTLRHMYRGGREGERVGERRGAGGDVGCVAVAMGEAVQRQKVGTATLGASPIRAPGPKMTPGVEAP